MESNKILKEIQDWAANLGYTLPDGSAPPGNHFALLVATPHRRQLWQSLVESVQPRQKIQHMRKQILVARLRERRQCSAAGSTLKQVTDRIDLWQKQSTLETEIKEKRSAIIKLESVLMTKASDLLFEICKLSELEKLSEDITEKSVILKLLNKRKKKLMETLDEGLSKVKSDRSFDDLNKSNLILGDHGSGMLLNPANCKCLVGECSDCELLSKIDSLCESDAARQHLWEESIKSKRILLEKFSAFLSDSSEKNLLGEKESEMGKKLNVAVTQLKQKATEKSLQTMINSTKRKLLDGELEKLEEGLLEEVGESNEKSLDGTFTSGEKFTEGGEKGSTSRGNYLAVMELKLYREFLTEEVKRLEEEAMKRKRNVSRKPEVEPSPNAFEAIVREIDSLESEADATGKEIARRHSKLEALLRSLREEIPGKEKAVETAADGLKLASAKEVDLFSETPLDVFRNFENSSGGIPLESAVHHLNNYGGELKHFFSAMSIPPMGVAADIISEVEKRKTVSRRIREFISEREKLAERQRKIQQQLSSITYEREFCEKNFKESDGILENVSRKTDELWGEVDFVEKILNYWVEQPYRSMIRNATGGRNRNEENATRGRSE